MYADGGGLYLRVTPEGARNWVLRYMLDRRPRWMGLGPLALYGLQEARAKALDARRKRHEGIDPIEARRAERARQRLDAAKAITFKQCADSYIAAHRAGWRSDKHAAQWWATLAALRLSRHRRAAGAGGGHGLVLKVLEPIWTTKPETAGRRARAHREHLGLRQGARLSRRRKPGALARPSGQLLPARSKVRQVEHHAALPYAELPAFLVSLRDARGHRSPRAGIFDPHGRAHRRSNRRALERNRLARQDLDGAGRAHEGAPRTPRPAVRAGARDPPGNAGGSPRRRRRRLCVSRW